jgi:hypothetical protein
VSNQPKKKNNHFVPQSYLRRFCSVSERQVGLFNLKSGHTVETAPIKSQCARDYFYTKNSIFEEQFSTLEGQQKSLFDRIISEQYVPKHGSDDHHALMALIMFQAGRTVATAAHQDHLANEFGKAMLRRHLEKEKRDDLLAYLPQLKISMPGAVIDAVGQHLAMYPLIGDMDITLFINASKEDFLTSDHPIAACNNLPASSPFGANTGFSSRGLIILFPLSPRALLLLTDPEVYKVECNGDGVANASRQRDVVELNLPQCLNAHDNLYFASSACVAGTLEAFNKRKDALRKPPPSVTEAPAITPEGRNGVLLAMPAPVRRMTLPKAVELRRAARTGNYRLGNAFVRDPIRTTVVRAELDRLQKLREEATKRAENEQPEEP